MMVETMLESSQDFGMSNGALPQWKRELLQRRAARSRPAPPSLATPPPPAQPPPDEDEELRYGPGIVKRLKSRYLSLALRDAPRRRPSVLRRAASLEHLLDERPPPAPRPPPHAHARAPRPASVAAPPALIPAPRRDIVKRARSVDALSRLDSRDEPHPPSPSPPPPHYAPPPSPHYALPPSPHYAPPPSPHYAPPLSPHCAAPPSPQPHAPALSAPPHTPPPSAPPPHAPPPPPPVPSPRPPLARSARPPRRPTPLLRETERPPPDVVRSALRKFEAAPARRTAPAARVSAVLRGLEGPSRTSTPEPREPREPPPPAPRSPTPPIESIAPIVFDEQDGAVVSVEARPVSRAALEGIARAGSSMRFAFEAPRRGSHLPPLAAANPVLVGRARRVGVIRPMPAPTLRSPEPPLSELDQKFASPPSTPRLTSPAPSDPEQSPPVRLERKEPPPSALVEPIPRSPPEERTQESPQPEPQRERDPEPVDTRPKIGKPLLNGYAEPKPIVEITVSRLGGADTERAWSGTSERKTLIEPKDKKSVVENKEQKLGAPWAGGSPLGARRGRAPPPAATSIVFNFSDRKEVPDYIENDGIILRGSRRTRLKAGEPGVVALRAGAGGAGDAGSSDEEGAGAGPPSPCSFRFVNDNVLINGRSCMAARPNRDRQARLKLQFDDSLTRTFEYPSETSLVDEGDDPPVPLATLVPLAPLAPPAPLAPAAPHQAHNAALIANTHIASASLCRYTPSKMAPAAFQLGVTRHQPDPADADPAHNAHSESNGTDQCDSEACGGAGAAGDNAGDARPCGADARSWSAARTHATDLLFW